jgi:taurine dioxygenase
VAGIEVRPLQEGLSFGARIRGLDRTTLADAAVRAQIVEVFEDRGLLVFEEMERSGELQMELSHVFGPPMDHAMATVRSTNGVVAGVIELAAEPGNADLIEVDGVTYAGWLPWHYDACYAKELYRGAVLRALEIPPEGGRTGFACGIQMYQALSPAMRETVEKLEIVYHPARMMTHQKYGLPPSYRLKHLSDKMRVVLEAMESQPRAVHPAVWTRRTGERVLHISPWQADGIYGQETPEGDALLEAICREMYAKMTPYWHRWSPGDMVVWDNWRTLHSVSGHDPAHQRRVHRATVRGDYGLGRWELDTVTGQPAQAMA